MSSLNGQAALAARCAEHRSEEGAREAVSMPGRAAAPAARPLLIGVAGQTCLAWWHAPAEPVEAGSALPLAVVLASSWGEEDMAAYDRLRALAVALAEGGLGTLRFEWPDTGDSSAATGTTTVADALAAFDAAAGQALALSGHARLAFAGLRLGALLAAHAATARQDVDALVALLPVASGRAFVRDQNAQDIVWSARASAGVTGSLFDAAELPVSLGGFAVPVRRLEALSGLKWPSAATTSVLEALLLRPAQSPAHAAADALARMGMRVRERAHEDLSCGPSSAGATDAMTTAIGEIVRWLQERAVDATVMHGVPTIENFGVADPGNGTIHAAQAAARLEAATVAVLALSAADAPVWMRLRAGAVALRERVVLLEDARKPLLVGVLTELDAGAVDQPQRRAIVLLSSGRERRIGPHRVWVSWARHRAARGDVMLRLDMAGVGDSAARASSDPCRRAEQDDARVVEDLSRAVAWLRREHGVRDFTIVGAGLGASHAWRAALEGVDVRMVVAIDAPVLRGPSPGRHPDASFAVAARLRPAVRRYASAMGRILRRPRQDDLAAEVRRASARGVAMSVVCATREDGLGLIRQAMGRRGLALVRERRVTVSDIALADPTFASLAGRADLCARLDALCLEARSTAALPIALSTLRAAKVGP